MELFFSALGLAIILEGIPYFTFPNQIKELAKRLPGFSNGLIRTFGIIIIAIGLVIIYFSRRFF
jgi:uncharacterized protein YjeT (DUF2065 family)